MRKLLFFFLALNTLSAVAQKSNTPPPPPPPPPADQYQLDSNYYKSPSGDSNKVFDLVAIQVVPKFPGGDTAMFSFLRNNIVYPKIPRENGVQGKVFVTFIIDKQGYATDIALYRGAPSPQTGDEKYLASYKAMAKELDEEALRVVRLMPKWSPGIQNDKPVKTRFILPLNFKLQ